MSSQVVKSSQEQALASWVYSLNQLRLSELIENIAEQDVNFDTSLSMLQNVRFFVGSPQNILGSNSTKHGEIAEYAQVYFSNSRKAIEGLEPEYTFEGVGRLAPEDYLLNGKMVQSKFYAGDLGNRSFDAICKHLTDYPDFIKNGGTYDIPKDQYEHIIEVLNKKQSLLSRSDMTLVKKIREWEHINGINFTDKVKPSIVDYRDVQLNAIDKTIDAEEVKIRARDKEIRDLAYKNSKPTILEGARVTVTSAAIEGGVVFCLKLYEKLKSGKRIAEFTNEDWDELGVSTLKGVAVGGIRGATVYVMTNYTTTPAPVASALVTAIVGVLTQAYKLKTGEIDEEEFIVNSQVVTMEFTISSISSLLGQMLIPIPFLGPVIGNALGTFLYGIARDYCDQEEQLIIEKYNQVVAELNSSLNEEYQRIIAQLDYEFKKFTSIVELAFDEDVNRAFLASIKLAEYVGVDNEIILRDKAAIDDYFNT